MLSPSRPLLHTQAPWRETLGSWLGGGLEALIAVMGSLGHGPRGASTAGAFSDPWEGP